MELARRVIIQDKKYDPSDPHVCRSCRDFLELDFSRPIPKSTLPGFRRTAASGCFRCQVLLAGIDKFQSFWKGSEPGQPCQGESWNEDEIKVSVWPQEGEHMQVVLTRRSKREERYEALELEFYSHTGEESPFYEFRPAGDVPERSDSELSFSTIQSWIETCQCQHQMCRMTQTQAHMPTRLIHVGSTGKDLMLCLTSEIGEIARYAALSHSWGRKELRKMPVPKTTRSNLTRRMKSLSRLELTKTFQDAVEITRRLGLHYLWIDSLCIIQDDDYDWALEASRMARNYQDAHVVIAATRSRTGDDGCFSRRSPSYKISKADATGKVFNVYVKKEISHRDFAESPATFNTMPLFDRAWVFQERLLATRVIHYTEHEIMWECKQSLHCECQGIESGRDWPRGKNTGNFKLDYGRLLASNNNILQRYKHWSKIVAEYSVRSLAYDSDRLPALSGIVGQIQLPEMGRYLAGIWESSLPHTLGWKTTVGVVEKNRVKRKPSEWRAPSWSWASVEAECSMWIADPEDEVEYHCQILEAECTLVSQDPYGQVSDGHLILSAETFWATFRYEKWSDNRHDPKYVLHFGGHSEQLTEDVPLEAGHEPLPDESPILVAVIESQLIPNKAEQHKPIWKGKVPNRWWTGLALKCSSRRENAYERIGEVSGRTSRLPDRQTIEVVIV